ncbi:MAG: hypothetical protein ACMUIU_05970 [bacterium]
MFHRYLNKKVVNCCLLFTFLIFCSFIMVNISADGQIFPFPPYIQPFIPLASNTYNFSSYNPAIPASLTSPYLGLYNPFPLFNYNFSPFSSTPFFPQATAAGSLVPFTSFYTTPFPLPYTAAAYFAAAVLPANVAGTWAGVWTSTFLLGGVITGEISMTLTQTDTEVAGTAVFLLNKILKYGAYVVGTVDGNILTLNSTIVTSVTGTMTYDVTFTATVTDLSMEGTYVVINLATGLVAEEGTFTATRL